MTTPQVLGPRHSLRCPVCGGDRLSVRSEGFLFCQSCRNQFRENGESPGPARADAQESSIGPGVTIRGSLAAFQNVVLDGTLDGPVAASGCRFTIGPAGRVNGNVQGGEVIAMGTVRGNIVATRRVAIRAGASVIGNIRTASLRIEDGAYFKGRVEMD